MIIGMLALGLVGCAKAENPTTNPMPPLNPGFQGRLVEVSYDDLLQKKNITQEIDLTYPQSLVVSLASNPSTGFSWSANATISDPAIISQYEHNVVPAASSQPGAPGKEVWTFKPLKAGIANISMGYSRPWQGGEQNEWTFKLIVTVK